MPNRVFTIGRSTHCIDEFMKALRNCGDLEFGPTRLSGYEMKLRISPFVQERPNLAMHSWWMGGTFFGEPGVAQHVELRGWSAEMPIFKFLVVTGFALITLLVAANAMLEPGSPPIITSQRSGLPEPRPYNAARTLTTAPAPAPDMTSQDVRDAQPKSVPEALPQIEPAAREARAEALSNKLRLKMSAKARPEAQPQNNSIMQTIDHQQSQFDRFSIKGY